MDTKRLGNCPEAFATRRGLLSQHGLSGQRVLDFGSKHREQRWGLPVETHHPQRPASTFYVRHFY